MTGFRKTQIKCWIEDWQRKSLATFGFQAVTVVKLFHSGYNTKLDLAITACKAVCVLDEVFSEYMRPLSDYDTEVSPLCLLHTALQVIFVVWL